MNVAEFRSKIKPDLILSAGGQKYEVKEVVKFRLDDGSFYIKCFLNDGCVLADDANDDSFLLVKEVKTEFLKPFEQSIKFDGKDFEFLYTAHAIAEETAGEPVFKKDASERFWDYKANDGSYLSLGIDDETNARSDFYGRIVTGDGIGLDQK